MLLDCDVCIMGTPWRVCVAPMKTDKRLDDCDGFTDKTSKLIMVEDCRQKSNLDHPLFYMRKVIRHEIIHAFLIESGLDECMMHRKYGHEEQMVDWFAHQFHKIRNVVENCEALLEKAITDENDAKDVFA